MSWEKGRSVLFVILAAFFLLFFSTFALSGCTQAPLKIGFMADLSGRASSLGISGRNGAELAVGELNETGGINGRKIELLVRDDKGIPDEAVRIDDELIHEGILFGIGHFTSGPGVAGLEVFKKAGVLMISPTVSTDSLSDLDDNFIRVIASNKYQSQVLADAALKDNNPNGVALVYEYNNRAYSEEVCDFFRERYEASGGRITIKKSFTSSPIINYDEIVDIIIASKADGAVISAGGLDLGILVQKLRIQKPDFNIYSGMWGMTEDAVRKGGKAAEGTYFAGVYDSEGKSEQFQSFRKKYMETYKEEPTFSSVYSYETMQLIGRVLKTIDKYDTQTIKEKIINMRHFDGLQDDFDINGFGDTNRSYFLFRISNNNYVRVK